MPFVEDFKKMKHTSNSVIIIHKPNVYASTSNEKTEPLRRKVP